MKDSTDQEFWEARKKADAFDWLTEAIKDMGSGIASPADIIAEVRRLSVCIEGNYHLPKQPIYQP